MNRRMLTREEESSSDVQVTREDQDNINKFSALHQKQGILKEELAKKEQEKEALDDVAQELELVDEDELIPYQVGDSFLHLPLPEVQELLEAGTEKISKEIAEMEETVEKNRETMEALKVVLYAKFGKAINLDI